MNNSAYPIRVVADRTGLKPDLIRMWERRYQTVQPERTSTGRRFYTDQDIFRLNLLKNALEYGWRIGDISMRPDEELAELITSHEQASSNTDDSSDKEELLQAGDRNYLNECLEAVKVMELPMLEKTLESAESAMGFPDVLDLLVSPLLFEIGQGWERGEFKLSQEHLLSATLRRYLDTIRIREKARVDASTLLSTTPSGQNHELGALMIAATAAASGWNSIYMNPSTPAADIAWAADSLGAKVVALSIVYPSKDALLISELQHLTKLLSHDTYILVGGTSADFLRPILQDSDSCIFVNSQREAKAFLKKIQEKTEPGRNRNLS